MKKINHKNRSVTFLTALIPGGHIFSRELLAVINSVFSSLLFFQNTSDPLRLGQVLIIRRLI